MTQVAEDVFDINSILRKTYVSLKQLQEQHKTELIFEMDSSIPRELRGNTIAFTQLLVTLLSFILQNSKYKEVLLTIAAPKDFMYEESVSFKIIKTSIPKEKILAFLETGLGNTLNVLNGEILKDNSLDVYFQIPFMIGELGFRRHYRLPSECMLEKKVLLIVQSENITKSIVTMFKYFPYDVDVGFHGYKEENIDLLDYDLVIIEEHLLVESFCKNISKAQMKIALKYVILGDKSKSLEESRAKITTYLMKPVTQESIFELIVSVFEEDKFQEKKKVLNVKSVSSEVTAAEVIPAVPASLQNNSENSAVHEMIEEKKSQHTSVLNTRIGLQNSKRKSVTYAEELENFLEIFYKSDLYFRQIVNEKQTNKIKDFCIDLEKQSKTIGAESMQKFSDIVSLIFVYNKLDMLPIYPGRYHIELTKLVDEIKKYLHIR